MPRIRIEIPRTADGPTLCRCGEPKNHDEGFDFFVTCVRDAGTKGQRTLRILGPYATHGEALANVDRGKSLATTKDPFCDFDSFGTVKSEAGRWKGVLGA